MSEKDDTRKEAFDSLRAIARTVFEKDPKLRSVMLGVAQYWADEADDAVHYDLCASERELPLWPHVCAQTSWDDDAAENVPGELCWNCGEVGYLEDWDDNGSAIQAFEAFCHESGSQEERSAHNYLPVAVARRAGSEIEIEVVGHLERPESELAGDYEDVEADPTWDDARARELFELVAASPSDDGPRRVLADYLLERENPRGEYIALSLEGADAEKRAELFREFAPTWMHPIHRVAPLATAKWSRGFLKACDVWAGESDLQHVRGALAWGTVERLRVCANSEPVLDPVMRSLRTLGAINASWSPALLEAKRPWSIETLEFDLTKGDDLDAIYETKLLPKLRHLAVGSVTGAHAETEQQVATITRAAWWKQLDRLSVVVEALDSETLVAWSKRRRELGVPWLAVSTRHIDPTFAKGWEVAFGPNDALELTLRGFGPHSSLDALREIVKHLPSASSVKLVPSEYYAPSPVDHDRLWPKDSITN